MQSQPFKKRFGGAIAGTAVIATVIASAAGIAANAAPDDTNEGLGQYLSGTVAGFDLATIASLGGAHAENPSGLDADIDPLTVTLLNSLDIPLTGTQLIGDGETDGALALGAVSQRATAPDDGSASAGSGTITTDGAIAIDPEPTDGISSASLDLDAFLGTQGLIETLELNVGALAATASQVSGGSVVSDYLIGDLSLDLESSVLGALGTTVTNTVTSLQTTLSGLTALLNTAIDADLDLGALASVDANLALTLPNLSTALTNLVSDATDIIQVDLTTGAISVDLQAFLLGQGIDLENLEPNTPLLTPAVVTALTSAIVTEVTSLLNATVTAIEGLVNGTAITGSIEVSTVVLGGADLTLGGTLAAPSVDGDLTGLLGTILGALGLDLDGVEDLLEGVIGTTTTALFTALDGLGTAVDNAIIALPTDIGAITALLDSVLSLTGNVQPTAPPVDATTGDLIGTNSNSFTVRALQIGLLSQVVGAGDGLATINLASATVRVDGETDADADVTDADVTDGTDVDTDAVADQDGDADTTDGDTDADSDADADADADAPAGDGDADGNLATTGFDGMVLGGFGILALLTGLALYLARRKSIEV